MKPTIEILDESDERVVTAERADCKLREELHAEANDVVCRELDIGFVLLKHVPYLFSPLFGLRDLPIYLLDPFRVDLTFLIGQLSLRRSSLVRLRVPERLSLIHLYSSSEVQRITPRRSPSMTTSA